MKNSCRHNVFFTAEKVCPFTFDSRNMVLLNSKHMCVDVVFQNCTTQNHCYICTFPHDVSNNQLTYWTQNDTISSDARGCHWWTKQLPRNIFQEVLRLILVILPQFLNIPNVLNTYYHGFQSQGSFLNRFKQIHPWNTISAWKEAVKKTSLSLQPWTGFLGPVKVIVRLSVLMSSTKI